MWRFDGEALRRARKAKAWTAAQLADRAGVAVGLISHYETGKSLASDASAEAIAKALGKTLEEIAKRDVRGSSRRAPASKTDVSVKAVSLDVAVPPPPALSRLEYLAMLERQAGCTVGTGDPPMLTATTFQSVMSAYGLHADRRFRVEGKVLLQRGLTPQEWKALGVKRGLSARFSVVREVLPGHELAVTVYAREPAHTARLQTSLEKDDGPVTINVRVTLTTDPSEFEGPPPLGFRVFGSDVVHGWAFVVESIGKATPVRKTRSART